LIPELRALVDIGRIGFRPAVEISYLPDTYQKVIFEYYQANDVTPSYAQALEMHTLDSKDQLNERKIERILEEMKGNRLAAENKLVFHSPAINKLLRNCTSQKEREEKVIRALQLLDSQEKQKKHQKRVTSEVASL
jgi:ParB family chromosome partitioning protein